jgi:hypothetical protein
MRRLLCLAAVAGALGTLPATAQASVHWYKGSSLLGATHTPVASKGKLTLTYLTGTFAGDTVKCTKVKDSGAIWNPSSGGNGEDEITTITFGGCKTVPAVCPPPNKVRVVAHGLPWHSELFEKPPKKGDMVDGVELEVLCLFTPLNDFAGELIGPVSPGVFEADEVLLEGSEEAEVELPDRLKGPGPGKIKIK